MSPEPTTLREQHLRLHEVGVPGRGRLLVSAGVRGAPGLAPGIEELLASVPILAGRVLDLTASAGAGVYACAPEADVVVLEPSAAGYRAARETFVDDAHVEVVAGLPWEAAASAFDAVLLAPPADRGSDRVRADIEAAAVALKPGAPAYLVGHKDLGAKRYEREAGQRFGGLRVLSRQRGWRVAELRLGARADAMPSQRPVATPAIPADAPRSEHADATPTGRPDTTPSRHTDRWLQVDMLGERWWSLPGVFKGGRLDAGSAALWRALLGLASDTDEDGIAAALAAGPAPGSAAVAVRDAAVLDLGCGTGTLGWGALRVGAASLVALEDDLAAVRCAVRNLTGADATVAQTGTVRGSYAGHAPGSPAMGPRGAAVRVLHSDLDEALEPDARFDVALLNPPFHLGKQVRVTLGRTFLEVVQRRLRPGGWLAVVANRALPYEAELAGWSRWETMASDATYKVLRAWR